MDGQRRVGDRDTGYFLDRRPDCQEFNKAAAYLRNISFDADDIGGIQRIGFSL